MHSRLHPFSRFSICCCMEQGVDNISCYRLIHACNTFQCKIYKCLFHYHVTFVLKSVLAQCARTLWNILHNVLILGTLCIIKILPTYFWVFPTCWWIAFCFYLHFDIIFVDMVFYVGNIGVAILEHVNCVCPMRFCRFFGELFAYKRHAWACISYHLTEAFKDRLGNIRFCRCSIATQVI